MRILFADDHTLVREGIRPFLNEVAEEVEILEAESLPTAQQKAAEGGQLDLILLDLKMPGMNGFDGAEAMIKSHPGVPVVILSGHYNRKDVRAALDYGISGYIPKSIGGMAMVNALKLILTGEKYLPSDVFSEGSRAEDDSILQEAAQTSALKLELNSERFTSLTAREGEILSHLVDGLTNKLIARELDIQEITIKIHVRNIYRKIGAKNRAQAVRISLQSGWMPG